MQEAEWRMFLPDRNVVRPGFVGLQVLTIGMLALVVCVCVCLRARARARVCVCVCLRAVCGGILHFADSDLAKNPPRISVMQLAIIENRSLLEWLGVSISELSYHPSCCSQSAPISPPSHASSRSAFQKLLWTCWRRLLLTARTCAPDEQ